jgi:hypothetical protein
MHAGMRGHPRIVFTGWIKLERQLLVRSTAFGGYPFRTHWVSSYLWCVAGLSLTERTGRIPSNGQPE